MRNQKAKIQGIFVQSHVDAVRNAKGEEGVRELEKRFGKPVSFTSAEYVSVADDLAIVGHVLDILSDDAVDPKERDFEAGRLHFQNFITTPLAKSVLSIVRSPKTVFKNATYILPHIMQGVAYQYQDLRGNRLQIVMEGYPYPLDHMRGFFWEWLRYWGYDAEVTAKKVGPAKSEYILSWKDPGAQWED